ncbi:rab-GTPase-TBC domain-containing protein [Phycomyces blakesleeanus]|uniref:Rab-GAP TBC domain-containing protein n=2 Tax=Phycomyces blakesleeanus TaxID=4837 RepID=A0A167PHS6_PHYB8|nr:hypothetical protein PHYBLDRAFT_141804 [Phycomyces blakesleeanus NRRL 1555(-)]OAD77944.1 hypothetical protein PHYBLDRAFT_141804 [Phycomyces blakesleeanus NRRL 1555(-)]|eukprot:XP_018295984.1 hypothetical protein PHYBLDRAFT_141804 [Phycomyces blakesleeanus NRRL 1555(-)]
MEECIIESNVFENPAEYRYQLILGRTSILRTKLRDRFGCIKNNAVSLYPNLIRGKLDYEGILRHGICNMSALQPHFRTKRRKEKLFRVLKAYSLYDKRVGCCPNLKYIAGSLLTRMNEAQAFRLLTILLSSRSDMMDFRSLFFPSTDGYSPFLEYFDFLMAAKLPNMYNYMLSGDIRPSVYISHGFKSLFGLQGPAYLIENTIDLLLIEGPWILPYCMLALLESNEDTIMKMNHDEIPGFLWKDVFKPFESESSTFISSTLRLADIYVPF